MMRSLLYVVTSLAVIGLAFWAYRENYRTQEAQTRAQGLQQAIAATRHRLRVLNAEWAYLNRPDRLMDLVELNYERLELMPMRSDQFGRIDQVAFPPPPYLAITNPVDVSNMEPAQ
jgi:hypothetical protein